MSEVKIVEWGILILLVAIFFGLNHLSKQLSAITGEIVSVLNEMSNSLTNIENKLEKIEINQSLSR
jgi:hypothetical protein